MRITNKAKAVLKGTTADELEILSKVVDGN